MMETSKNIILIKKKISSIISKIKITINGNITKLKTFFSNNKKDLLRYFLSLLFIYIVALIPLIIANFNYIDDLGRTLNGYRSWDGFSRFGSQYLSTFIHCGRHLTDVSPLPLILAVITLCIASIILIYTLSDNKKFSFWKVLAVIPLGLSPYFLECLSYKYDCIYMAISILACILPFMFYRKKSYIYFVVTILSIILMCITYQASSGIFPMIVLVLTLKLWNNKEDNKFIFKFLITSVIAYIIGLSIFKFGIMREVDVYVSSSTFPFQELISGAYNNFKKYLTLIKLDFTKWWILFIIIINVSFIITSNIKSKQKKYFSMPVSIIILFLAFILCFGMYPILENPLFAMRAMYGYGAFLAIIGIYAVDLKANYICKLACFMLAWSFINFSLTYGNALAEQKRYTDFRVQTLISDINDCEIFSTTEEKIVVLNGNIGKSPVIEKMSQKYKVLNRIVPDTLAQEWMWSEYYFYNYFDLKNIKQSNKKLDRSSMNLIKNTMYEKIYSKDNYVLIILK